jgi:hypothetical protein
MSNKPEYRVCVDDNFHYMDVAYRYELRSFDDCRSAVAACKQIVDEFLARSYRGSMTSEELWEQYVSFGEDPWIATDDPDCRRFSAWGYAKERCKEICRRSA